MSEKPEKGWWYSATTEQRLAQIDGGIECGMTAKQVAMNCGARLYENATRVSSPVIKFAGYHGRKFKGESKGHISRVREGVRLANAKRSQNMTDAHFNIFGLGGALPQKPDPEHDELRF